VATEGFRAIVDADTAARAAVGLAAGICGVSVTAAMLASLAMEFGYLTLKYGAAEAAFSKTRGASSLANHTVDVLASVGGFYAGRQLVARARRQNGGNWRAPARPW
jgi:hypothetical protein